MKKKNIFLAAVCAFALNIQAQNMVQLSFTGQLIDGSYIQLDSVKIQNITRSWTETLYFPDTVLEMEEKTGKPPFVTSLENGGLELSSAFPNPFNGTTDIVLQLPADETVNFSLYDINGKICLSRSLELEAGKHTLKLTTAAPQIYFLQVRTSLGSKAVKLFNRSKGVGFGIEAVDFSGDHALKEDKLSTAHLFYANDAMLFIGYRTDGNETDTMQIRTRQAAVNTMYTFPFQIGYKMGDVYYENGIAIGMVWWLADTIAVANDVAYGEHGKLISLTEPVDPPNQYGLMWGVSSINVQVPAYDSIDGRINTPIIKHIRDSLANDSTTIYDAWRFQAMAWCVDSLGGDWYLPATNELRSIIELVVPTLNPALEKISGAAKFTYSAGAIYWSSTADEADNERAYAMKWFLYPEYSEIPDYHPVSADQTTYGRVRAVRWF
jgi:hypothetical protein